MNQRFKDDYYELLDIASGAATSEIEEAYKKALSDLSGDSVAIYSLYTPEEKEELISRLNEAYEVLSDPERRAAYDTGAAGKPEPAVTREFELGDLGPAVDTRHFKRYGKTTGFVRPPVTASDDNSIITEQYRILYSRIHRMADEGPLKVIAVTSAVKGEGKSVTSLNLAYITACEFKKRVLLVECDLRKSSTLSKIIEREEACGLAEVLEGRADIRDAVCRVDGTSLYVLTSGTCSRSSSELIDSPYLKSLLKGFRDEFDYVFVDTPPILPLADMNIITRLVDGTILVVRAGATPKKVVLNAAQSLSEGRFIGIVLNGAEAALASYYY
ncbi:MAG: polysaccharide biosynthesis tyrosine autokinase [Candidatus Methylomirabilis sp.]|nr:polysaccharide biosynthesis tyrosine autokinase [Deltaproteobacteria bacterium]